MKNVAPKYSQQLAEDEIVMACDGLTMPEALGALLEVVAQILADRGIDPGTEDFDSFLGMVTRSLPQRVVQLRWEALAAASQAA
jgi:hypothetical protein